MDSQFIADIMDTTMLRTCSGGIFKRTTESGYRLKNLICAFNFNNEGRYGYSMSNDGEIQSTGAKYLENDMLKDPHIDKYERGFGYFVDFRTQGGLRFMTTEKFTKLGELLRERNLKYTREEDFYKNGYNDNEKFLPNYASPIKEFKRGDEYNIPSKIELPNNFLSNYKGGLYEYNSGYRSVATFGNNSYKFSNPYGISKEVEDSYTTDKTYSRSENIEIINNKDGKFFDKNTTNGLNTYGYYEGESYSNGVGEFKPDSLSDGSSIVLSERKQSSNLLRKTNELFRDAKIGSLINRFHSNGGLKSSEILSSFDGEFGISRGRNLLVKDAHKGKRGSDTGYDNPYCRTWTAHHQYARLRDRMRPFYNDEGSPLSITDTQKLLPETMRPYGGAERLGNYTVLGEDGFVKIAPGGDDFKEEIGNANIKKYMFSIENLAWRDIKHIETELSKEQIGPNGGRIMWFPPYNLKFSENVSVNWNSNNFIGRGEQIYTYTNTDRSGTLSFTILIDHPSILNTWRGTADEVNDIKEAQDDLLRFFAGCGTLKESLTGSGKKEENPLPKGPIDPKPVYDTKKIAYVIFFPNNFSAIDYTKTDTGITIGVSELMKYETEEGKKEPFTKVDEKFKDQVVPEYNRENKSLFSLNDSDKEDEYIKSVFGLGDEIEIRHLNKIEDIGGEFKGDKFFGFSKGNCKIDKIDIKGFATKNHGKENNNILLCKRRAESLKRILKYYANEVDVELFEEKSEGLISVEDIDSRKDINTLDAKVCRAAIAIFNIRLLSNSESVNLSTITNVNLSNNINELISSTIGEKSNTVIISNTDYTYDNEYLYFKSLSGDKMIYKNIVSQIRYFNPAFHSVTPEGFNSRLTFLHQCTRQGPTVTGNGIGKSGNNYLDYAGNLGFGRSPYCVLRIGDFFNTKICIDSLSIDYDTGSGIQWDLNQEGAGVQPMFANININFKFIGGQDITGPIERLQNAITSNYYANASVYDRHADNDKEYYDAVGQIIDGNLLHRIEKNK